MRRLFLMLILLLCFGVIQGQGRYGQGNVGNTLGNLTGGDSIILKHRVPDNIKIHYHYLNSIRIGHLDSSINDFDKYFPLSSSELYLGNLGNPAASLIFHPEFRPGFDAGFHVFDPYRYTLQKTTYFNTTKPFTQLGYLLGASQEQMIDVLHTQNPSKNFNFGFRYRKINSPGTFRDQSTNNDNYNVFAHLNSANKRYHTYLSWVVNKLNSGENGGIKNVSDLTNPIHADRLTIPTNLGDSTVGNFSLLNSIIPVRSSFTESSVLYSQSYDWGTADTIHINDSTDQYMFYPVFRIQHTLEVIKQTASFVDTIANLDANFYAQNYQIQQPQLENLEAMHQWRTISNDISLQQFPVPKNPSQFIKAGLTYEAIRGDFLYHSIGLHNLIGHFEYRNKTRNEKWDMDLQGKLYLVGNYFGNYLAHVSLSRLINKNLGNVRIGFSNVNRRPDYLYQFFESNRFVSVNKNLKNENTTQLMLSLNSTKWRYSFQVNYFLFTQFTYLENYFTSAQYSTAFPLLQILLHKQFHAGHFDWYTDLAFQQTDGASPLHVPNFWTRDRFSYENFLFKNHLQLCTGIEIRYNSAYFADDYSPLLQHFVSQKIQKISNKPYAALFVDFAIRSFTAYVRAENLNTFLYSNNFAAPLYPYPGFGVSIGLKWGFVD
ncbi:MAG: putative porin [Chitinophagaceae bacterium]